jgi:hypothetical protein
MGERSDQIEREIAATRNELSENFSELGRKVKSAVDWRHQVEQRPGTMLALAFGGGVVLSALFPLARHSRPRSKDDKPSEEPYGGHSTSAFLSPKPPLEKPSQTRQNMQAFTGALFGLAINKLTGLVDSVVPGFEREFNRNKGSKGNDPYRPGSASHSEAGW